MPTRLRLLKGATALLYVGPLFAGMCGLGWGLVAPFVGIFVVWLMVLRPEQWPASPAEWLTLPAWGAALAQVLSQLLLVTVLLAVGRGLGALAGFLPVVNPIFPLAVSFLAIPLCRMLWDARSAADQGIYLDDEAEAAQAPRAAAEAAAAIVPLLNLPDGALDEKVAAQVAQVMNVAGAEMRLKALAMALSQPDRSHAALRRALVVWASEPEVVAPGRVASVMAHAFAIADRNADLLRLYLPRAIALIAAFPDRAEDFPNPDQLRLVASLGPDTGAFSDLPDHLRADLRDGLQALARSVERAIAAGESPDEVRREELVQQAARPA
ncbi:MAG: hypothetical protein NTW20_14365 [Rhodobacterales bacterium]|nr:hypothetical protein [Rhodobacterales bacterium]